MSDIKRYTKLNHKKYKAFVGGKGGGKSMLAMDAMNGDGRMFMASDAKIRSDSGTKRTNTLHRE